MWHYQWFERALSSDVQVYLWLCPSVIQWLFFLWFSLRLSQNSTYLRVMCNKNGFFGMMTFRIYLGWGLYGRLLLCSSRYTHIQSLVHMQHMAYAAIRLFKDKCARGTPDQRSWSCVRVHACMCVRQLHLSSSHGDRVSFLPVVWC